MCLLEDATWVAKPVLEIVVDPTMSDVSSYDGSENDSDKGIKCKEDSSAVSPDENDDDGTSSDPEDGSSKGGDEDISKVQNSKLKLSKRRAGETLTSGNPNKKARPSMPAHHHAKKPIRGEKLKQETSKSAATLVPCNFCKRSFQSEHALEAHTRALHRTPKSQISKARRKK
ncbi:histone deacetylase HDT2-like isoform X1 [Papaver somniferum]|uniref:histone deacetylase HDT2-like isoform X1 n=2 Tax=Papaver somniferum TaxID=3469 RepID=UPI000E702A00|nr:histone deacetylase HDT2-like isoform X1 [Papaver somniferum]